METLLPVEAQHVAPIARGDVASFGIPRWRKYQIKAVDVLGVLYWEVNGVVGGAIPAALTDDIPLDDLPVRHTVHALRIKSDVAITGPTTCTAKLGHTANTDAFYAAGYDLKAAVTDANFAAVNSLVHAEVTAATVLICLATATVANLNTITAGQGWTVWVLASTLPIA